MVHACLEKVGHVSRRSIKATIRIIDQMNGSLIVRGGGKFEITIETSIERDLDFNGLNLSMIYGHHDVI